MSTNGGGKAVWSRKGDRIYYWNGEEIYEVPVELQPTVRLASPRLLFHLGNLRMQTFGRFNFVPTSNPDRFLMIKTTENTVRSHTDAIVVENWLAEFGGKK